MKKTTKTELIKFRVTPKFKQMATRKSEKAGHETLSAWLTKLIQRAR